MTKLKLANIFLQVLFIRICRIEGSQMCWGIMLPVIPFTGWGRDYLPTKRKIITFKMLTSFKANESI